jgi:hypothetical protein
MLNPSLINKRRQGLGLKEVFNLGLEAKLKPSSINPGSGLAPSISVALRHFDTRMIKRGALLVIFTLVLGLLYLVQDALGEWRTD